MSILALLAFNFTIVGKYAAYPWWHQHDSDSDPLYVAQAVTLVNDGPFDYIHHPGAVVSSGHGCAYRLASAITGWHPEYLDVRESLPDLSAWEILEHATRLSRWFSFVVFAVFVATFHGFVFWLTRNDVVTFLITFFVATSQVAIWHSRAIRPEVPSLLFSVLALWVVLALGRSLARGDDRRFAIGSISVGVVLALAMLSKIQVLPVVVVRVLTPELVDRGGYRLVLLVLAFGAIMDVVFTLRWLVQFNYYAIFSLVFYGIGLALFLGLEWRHLWLAGDRLRLTAGVAILLFGLLVSHVGYRTYELVTAPKATGISDQAPAPMLESTRAQNPNFWIMFDELP